MFTPDEGDHDPAYEIDLDVIEGEKDILEWVAHVSEKRWAAPRDIHDLLTATRALLDERREQHGREMRRESEVGAPAYAQWHNVFNDSMPGTTLK